MTREKKSGLFDAELVNAIKQDDEQAFYEIYTRYNTLLFTYAYRKLLDREEAKDIVQEVFIHFWHHRSSLPADLAISAYLYKAVLNKVLNVYKHKHVLQRFADDQLSQPVPERNDADFLIREKEIRAMIDQEIDAMPARMKEIYLLKKQRFLSTKAIAEELDLSEHTVSTQLKRAAKMLKARFGLVIYALYVLH